LPIFARFSKFEKIAKNGRIVKAIGLLFLPIFAPFSSIEKVAQNGRKVKAIAFLFCRFSPLFQKSKKSLKKDEKLRLTVSSNFCVFFKNRKSGSNWTKSYGYSLTFLPIFAPFSKMKKVAE
jgi:hypothetical protein